MLPFQRFLAALDVVLSILIGDGESAVAAKGARGDLDAGRSLATLVFADIYQAHDALNGCAFKAHGQDFAEAAVIFGVGFEWPAQTCCPWSGQWALVYWR